MQNIYHLLININLPNFLIFDWIRIKFIEENININRFVSLDNVLFI